MNATTLESMTGAIQGTLIGAGVAMVIDSVVGTARNGLNYVRGENSSVMPMAAFGAAAGGAAWAAKGAEAGGWIGLAVGGTLGALVSTYYGCTHKESFERVLGTTMYVAVIGAVGGAAAGAWRGRMISY